MTKEEREILTRYGGLLEDVRREVTGIAARMDLRDEAMKPFLEKIESHEYLLRGNPKTLDDPGLVEQQNKLADQVKAIKVVNWLMITTFVISAVSLWFR